MRLRAKRSARWVAASLSMAACAAVAVAIHGGSKSARADGPATQPAAAASTTTLAAATSAPQPAGAAGTAGARPATQPATRPTTIPSKIRLNFKDAPLDAVLEFMSKMLGFTVLKEGPINAQITVLSEQPVTPEQAVTMLNAALKSNGFTVIREDHLLRIVPRDKAKKGDIPVYFGSDPDKIPDTDEMITQVIPIQNISAAKLKDDLKGLIDAADMTSNEGSNTLIVTDAAAHIRRIVKIIAKLDQHESETSEVRIIQLRYANATAVAKMIETFFKTQGGPPQPQPGMPMQMQPGQQPGGGGGSQRHGQTVVTAADDRTNTLLVMASSGTMTTIEDIIKHIDTGEPVSVTTTSTRVFTLKFAQAETTSKLINDVYKQPQDNSYRYYFFGMNNSSDKKIAISASFDERTNSVVVTGPAEAMAGVEELIKKIDSNPIASVALKVFHLKYAEAYSVAGLLSDMFKPKSDNNNRFPYWYYYDNPPEQQSRGATVNITSDDRTNTIIVSAPLELMKAIERVTKELDADPSTEDTLFIYHLRNGQAQNLEYVLNVLFGNISNNGQNNQQQNGQNPNQNQNQNQNRLGNNNTLGGNGGLGNNGNSSGAFGGRRNNNNRNNRNNMNGQQNVAQAFNELTGKVFVVSNPDTNALIVTTARRFERQVRAIIEDLDHPVPQVLIKVLVVEVTHDNSADLGVDFSILNQRASGKGVTTASNMGNFSSYQANGGLAITLAEGNLQATLHALATEGKLDVLSRPYILASDNQEASIMIGQVVPIVRSVQVTDTGQIIATPDYQQVGIMLDVTPHINPDGLVILDVAPTISQLTNSSITIGPGVTTPIFNQRNAQSRVGIMNDQTIVIGGLMEDRKTSTVNKIPILGDIPLIGAVFSRTQIDKTKTELLIFLTPHVALQPDTLKGMSQDEMHGTELTPNSVERGMFQKHMLNMQRGSQPATEPTTQPVSPVNSIDLRENSPPHEIVPDTQPSSPQP